MHCKSCNSEFLRSVFTCVFCPSGISYYSAKLWLKSAYFWLLTLDSYLPIDSGIAYIEELHSDAHHANEEYVITFMLAGYVTLEGGRTVNIKPGMLTLVPSGVPHSLLKGKDIRLHWLSFIADSLHMDETHRLMHPFSQIRNGALPVFKLPKSRFKYVETLFSEIQKELKGNKSIKVLESLVCLILNEAGKASRLTTQDMGAETKVSKALHFIQAKSCEGISLKDVAGALHISPAYLATKVKNSTGYSVGQWIIRYRLKRALELLTNTDENIEAIGLLVGWQDTTNFIRQFKKKYQQTPTAWRRNQRQDAKGD